jgi:hypothetical protein
MATFSDLESQASVRAKINAAITKVDDADAIGNLTARKFGTETDLFDYSATPRLTVGTYVEAGGFHYLVVNSGEHVTTAGGDKLTVVSSGPAYFDAFGAVGDDSTDDTAAMQIALSSTFKSLKGTPGKTYLIDGGLTSSATGRTIDFTGCTVKLKANATSKSMLTVSGADSLVFGGTFNGNRANSNQPTPGTSPIFASFGVLLTGARSTCRGIYFTGCAGMGVKLANADDLTVEQCTIRDSVQYGIYGEAVSANTVRMRVINNNIDTTQAGDLAQGILLSEGGGFTLRDYTVSDNTVIGPTGASLPDTAINIAVRGARGVISGNHTTGGAMGFSEGGEDCVITGNNFLDLAGLVRYGIEPSGKFVASGNIVTDAYQGISVTFTADFDGSTITGNTLKAPSGSLAGIGVALQIVSGRTGRNITISGNSIYAKVGVRTTRDIKGLIISGNNFLYDGSANADGRGVFLDTPPAAAHVSVIGNVFTGFERPIAFYSLASLTVTDLFASQNNWSNDCGGSGNWAVEGSAVCGARVSVLGVANYAPLNIIDQSLNVFEMWSTSYNNPETLLQAGIGSIHHSLNSGGGSYRKNTGANTNTGWVAL